MTDNWITRTQAADILGVSERTISRYAATGRLTKYKTGISQTPFFSENQVRSLLDPRPVG